MKNTVLWQPMPCSLVEVHSRFGGTYCLRLLDLILFADYLLRLLFYAGDGSRMFPSERVILYQTVQCHKLEIICSLRRMNKRIKGKIMT
jgi:hypothetical protein